LGDVLYDITLGSASGYVSQESQRAISEGELVKECEKHGTDPAYFLEMAEELGED
jgi:hypothetical protein